MLPWWEDGLGSDPSSCPEAKQNLMTRPLMLLAVIVCRVSRHGLLDMGMIWCIHRGQKGRLVISFIHSCHKLVFILFGRRETVQEMSKVSPRFLSCGHLNHWKPTAQTEAGMIYQLLLLLAPGSHEDDGSTWTIIIPMSSCQPSVIIISVL